MTVSLANFVTTITDIQLMINNRPLTYITKEGELDVVTPNHLINCGTTFPSLVLSSDHLLDLDEYDEDQQRQSLLSSFDLRDSMLEKFRAIWNRDYLLSLRETHRGRTTNNPRQVHLKVGAVVLLKSPFKPRPYWTLVKIVELVPSSDGEVRSVKIQRPDGSVTKSVVSLLYPLELETDLSVDNVPDESTTNDDSDHVQQNNQDSLSLESVSSSDTDYASCVSEDEDAHSSRPRRQAAKRFQSNLKRWVKHKDV